MQVSCAFPTALSTPADLAVAARRIVWGRFLNAGQICVAPDHVYVAASVEARLLEELKRAVTAMFGPDPRQSPDYGRIINARHAARLQNLLASPQPDVREVDAVLADLQKNQGSKVVAGVDLQAVRDNLARSERIRQIAVEMQALAAKPGPEVPAQLQARMAEIQRLQAGMNASVAAPAAPAGANR